MMKKSLFLAALALGLTAATGVARQTTFSFWDGQRLDPRQWGYESTGPTNTSCCMYVNEPSLNGMKLVGMKVGGFQMGGQGIDRYTLWLSSELGSTHDLGQASGQIDDQSTVTVAFDQPWTVDGAFYAGYTVHVPDGKALTEPIPSGWRPGRPGQFYLRLNENPWQDYSGWGGPATIILLLETDTEELTYALRADGLKGRARTEAGKPYQATFNVVNEGTEAVTSLTYLCNIGGCNMQKTVEFEQPAQPHTWLPVSFNAQFPALDQAGTYPAQLTITQVNGKDNESPRHTLDYEVTVTPPYDDSALQNALTYTTVEGDPAGLLGTGAKSKYEAAFHLNDPTLVGMKVVGLKAPNVGIAGTGNYSAWISETLFDNEPDLERVERDPIDGELTVVFATPHEIGPEGLFLGYGLETLDLNSDTEAPLHMVMNANIEGGLFWKTTDAAGNWSDWRDLSKFYTLPLTVYLQGSNGEDIVVIAKPLAIPTRLKGEPLMLDCQIKNGGSNDISSLTYTCAIDGQSQQRTLDGLDIKAALGQATSLALFCGTTPEAGQHELTLTIDKVNGNSNNAKGTKRVANAALNVVDFVTTHTPLMEEATGTWCGWCPRGWLAMREMGKRHPDFIGVAYHSGDLMAVLNDADFPFEASSFPAASIDRGPSIDPFFGTDANSELGIENDWQQAKDCLALAHIEAKAEWADANKATMNVTASVTFALPLDDDGYKVAYLLVADGQTSQAAQHNYYAGRDEQGLLSELCQMPEYVTDMVFDEILVNGKACKGINGSLPAKIECGKTYSHNYAFATSGIKGLNGTKLADNPDNLWVVALVVDPQGRVVNATKARPATESAIGVLNINPDSHAAWYDLTGRRVDNPAKGIYIRVKDGKALKVCRQ